MLIVGVFSDISLLSPRKGVFPCVIQAAAAETSNVELRNAFGERKRLNIEHSTSNCGTAFKQVE